MSFKLRSTVSIYEYPSEGSKAEGVNHIVLSRERHLRQGERIPVSGDMTYDVETKGGWIKAKGEVRVIDGKTLGVRWKPSFIDALFYAATGPETSGVRSRISETREYAKWDKEQIIHIKEDETPLELGDTYHSEPVFPEVFTLVDKARIGRLTEKMLHRVEGTKRIDRKTELVYEP